MIRVAVVEDNPDNRLLVRAILEDRYAVSEYEDGPSALRGMQAERPDVVLLDISLPGMDGVSVLREIRRDEALRGLPVIALTAHAMTGDREKYLKEGFNDYLTKPILDESELTNALDRVQGGAR
jgi:CheY-like chemotaxis protein